MKLFRIEAENLNSLYGKHVVDLAGGLRDAPLFLVLGPTGAGKSTLMDAVALALFGQTPRLRSAVATAGGDQDLGHADARRIVSHGTGFGRAVLEFGKRENGSVVRYRATWRCQRARERADGQFQAPHRSIERHDRARDAWETLAGGNQRRAYEAAFATVLEGLTVEDFQRSVLLAQGEFAAFLKAKTDERAAILERLTNTTDYQRIGARAAERWKVARKALEDAEARLGGVAAPSPAERDALEAEALAARAALVEARGRKALIDGWRGWLERDVTVASDVSRATAAVGAVAAERAGHADELATLTEHARCASAAELLTARRDATARHVSLVEALPPLREAEGGATVAAERARAARDVCVATREQRAAEAREAAPEIIRARALRTALAAADEAQRKAGQQHDKDGERAAARSKEREATDAALASAVDGLRAAEAALAACEGAAPLAEALAGLDEAYKAQVQRFYDNRAKDQARDKVRARLAELTAAMATRAEAVAREEAALAPLEVALEAAARTLRAALADAPDAATRRQALHAEARALTARDGALAAFARALEGEAGAAAERDRLAAALDATRVDVAAQHGICAGRASDHDGLVRAVDDLRRHLDDLRWARGLAGERGRLAAGEACPLCGSTAHPYRDDATRMAHDADVAARFAALEVELAEREAARDAADKSRRRADNELTTRVERERGVAAQHAAAVAEAESKAGARGAAARDAGLDATAGPAEHAAVAGAVGAAREANEAARDRLESAEEAARVASVARDDRQRSLDGLRKEQEKDAARVPDLQDELARLTSEAAALAEERADHERALVTRIEAFGVAVRRSERGPEITEALDDARRRVAAYRSAAKAADEARRRGGDARAAHTTAVQREADAAEALTRAAEALAERKVERTRAAALASGALGGADPDAVERTLAGALERAEGSLRGAETEVGRCEKAHVAAVEKRAAVERQRDEGAAAAAVADERLRDALAALGLDGPEALAARLLPDGRVRALRTLAEGLAQRAAAANGQLEEARRAAAVHAAGRPADLPADTASDVLRAESAALDARIGDGTARVGALDERRKTMAEAASRRREAEAERDRAAEEHARWKRLHDLIGVRDGEGFKRFAQGLHMDELCGRANAHLVRLADRYRLRAERGEGGLPSLEFVVEDLHQASQQRPLTTLSGGETFLVSLSLALGLADFRGVRMPIDTLLLDEGFGTLDRETLGTAMEALRALYAGGTQVGIISHVTELREQIPARVIVEKLGNGRSQVRLELDGLGA